MRSLIHVLKFNFSSKKKGVELIYKPNQKITIKNNEKLGQSSIELFVKNKENSENKIKNQISKEDNYSTTTKKEKIGKREEKKSIMTSSKKNKVLNKKKETNTDLFVKHFIEYFPLKLQKEKEIHVDNNLTCFIPFEKILNKIKAISLAKNYLENLILTERNFDNFCDSTFSNIVNFRLEKIHDFKVEDDNIIKYQLSYNKSLKKNKYAVNLYNIKNFMCFGFDVDRKVTKNIKNLQHMTDHIIENPFNQFKQVKNSHRFMNRNSDKEQNKIEENSIDFIKSDLIINRDFNNGMGLADFGVDDLNRKYEEFKITLITQFYFSVIIENDKPNDEQLKLIVKIKDELDDLENIKEYQIKQIDFICEAEILKINYREYQESLRLQSLLEKHEKNLNISKSEVIIDQEDNMIDGRKFIHEESQEMIDYNQIFDILKNLSFLKGMTQTQKLKILDVDGINKNSELI